jgi:O-Antigen ligase
LFYFLFRSVKNPGYLLGIPFLMFLRHCIFFENVKIFSIPGRFSPDILLIVWMIIVWIILRFINASPFNNKDNNLYIKNETNSLDYIIIGLMIISIIDLFIVYIQNLRIDNVFNEFVTMFSLFLGFFIIKYVLRNFSLSDLSDFLFSIVLVNSLASCLYILHQGLHLTIYQNDEYISEIFQGQVITRTFWFMPLLWLFSISYLFVFKKPKSVFYFILLIINLLALFISYTRSFLIITIIIILLYYLLNAYKQNNFSVAAKNIFLTIIVGLILFVAISKIFPANTNYFFSRFKELKQNRFDEESNSLAYRFTKTGEIIDRIEPDKLILGYGPVTETQLSLVRNMQVTTWDLVWTGVLFRWGILGAALFFLLYTVSILKAFYMFMKRDDVLSKLALLFLLVIVSQVIESFVSATFLSTDRYAMGLWYLGVLSALLLADKNHIDSTTKVQKHE